MAARKRDSKPKDVGESRAIAVWEAQEFIRDFAQQGWPDHWDSFSIHCNMSLDELRFIGFLERADGIRACQRIVRVPVISEEVGVALWETLTAATRTNSAQQQDDGGVLPDASSSFSVSAASVNTFGTATSCLGQTLSPKELAKESKQQEKKLKRQLQRRRKKQTARASCAFCGGICSHHDNLNRPRPQIPVFTRLKDFSRSSRAMVKSQSDSDFWQFSVEIARF
ncbi:hypothetical protein MFIFM68171_06083 [Madurella fahalii]|uniref:Uncharacterized protein n=1 Tax=Madurella fahalii TaxID=1157608 RepID=A0ABQ0GDM8_9PEZI